MVKETNEAATSSMETASYDSSKKGNFGNYDIVGGCCP